MGLCLCVLPNGASERPVLAAAICGWILARQCDDSGSGESHQGGGSKGSARQRRESTVVDGTDNGLTV